MPEVDVTQLLKDGVDSGRLSKESADRIFSSLFSELRRLAEREMGRERADHTLQPTALLSEAYLRLIGETRIAWESRAHFFGIAARAMRRILIEHARGRNAAKRGGGWERITLGDPALFTEDRNVDAIELAQALERLAERSERMATVVELRVFAGFTGSEIAQAVGVSRKTIVDDWRIASMWLRAELAGETTP